MIEVKGLKKSFGKGRKKFYALKGISFKIERGEVFGLIGPNGAGKTTLIKCLLNLTRPDEGEILINGLSPSHPHVKKIIGFLPEESRLFQNLTGRENLHLFAGFLGLKRKDARKKVEELLNFVGLNSAGDQLLRTYSKGMAQRLSVAQALLNDPEILILDEPMSGLDPPGRLMMMELIGELKKRGKTILMSTHIISDVESACDSFLLLHEGEILKAGKIAEFYNFVPSLYVVTFDKGGKIEREEVRGQSLWEMVEDVKKKGYRILSLRQKSGGIEELFKELVGKR